MNLDNAVDELFLVEFSGKFFSTLFKILQPKTFQFQAVQHKKFEFPYFFDFPTLCKPTLCLGHERSLFSF